MAHAYFVAGEREAGVAAAVAYAEREMDLRFSSPDILIERHGLFAVDDARRVIEKAGLKPLTGDRKLFVIAANRLFHEAQNAMLKLFEEPPGGTTLVLVLPSEGDLIYTLRSRLTPLPGKVAPHAHAEYSEAFIMGTTAAREKIVTSILDDAKSDNDEEKQEARAKALRLTEDLTRAAHDMWLSAMPDGRDRLQLFLTDLDRLIPILHDRAAPLKPILEHILITTPRSLR